MKISEVVDNSGTWDNIYAFLHKSNKSVCTEVSFGLVHPMQNCSKDECKNLRGFSKTRTIVRCKKRANAKVKNGRTDRQTKIAGVMRIEVFGFL